MLQPSKQNFTQQEMSRENTQSEDITMAEKLLIKILQPKGRTKNADPNITSE